ncbi:unnamed protein product [Calicophoron daubneyi]|uniref:Geranylgeranyl transferase type-2 subunit alpha n=1 Tax=Calicophoron daubneyi TaxID=300641 RepID=A0AAV2SXJ8_CALDB
MHGRVKVWRSEEQEKARREKKERVEQEFRSATSVLFKARSESKYTEAQLHQLNAVVEISPDAATLWNYRREILQHLFMNASCSQERINSLLNDELSLTTRCLTSSPKSYTVWQHRRWVMKNFRAPNWIAEIEFCNAALKVDERNFHCWDYRRFVVAHGKIPVESELRYTDNSIEDNMSNYSAWHYRSELLSASDPVLESSLPLSPPPHMCGKNGPSGHLCEITLPKAELELVHNAIFTDPNDQSPWFYYWWILGRGIRTAYLHELYLSRSLERLVLVFTASKPRSAVEQLEVKIKVSVAGKDGSVSSFTATPDQLGGWQSVLKEPVSAVWWVTLSPGAVCSCAPDSLQDTFHSSRPTFDIHISIPNVDASEKFRVCRVPGCFGNHLFCVHCKLDANQSESLTRVDLDPLRLLNPIISPTNEPEALTGELENVRDLISMEPENKWALLTFVSLLRFVHPPDSEKEVRRSLQTLIKIDKDRASFYADMQASYAIQDALVRVLNDHSREISLTNLGVSHFHYPDWCTLMTKVDLSGNKIAKLPDTIAYLICLTDLNLDDNLLTTLSGLSFLPSLLHLSVQHNCLSDFASIEELLRCPKLRGVHIHGNKVTEIADFTKLLAEHPNSMNKAHSFIVTYEKPLQV